ncbi:MAG: hypothetical protein ACK4TK_06870 [Thiobacillaceae bacterium]
MAALPNHFQSIPPTFCEGIQYYGEAWPDFERYAAQPVIAEGERAVADPGSTEAAY